MYMASIGPQLPAHLLRKQNEVLKSTTPPPFSADEDNEDAGPAPIGPHIPANIHNRRSQSAQDNTNQDHDLGDNDDDDDAYVPALPPNLLASRTSTVEPISRPEKRVLGPSLPSRDNYDEDEDDEEDYGPKPSFSSVGREDDGVREFMEKEEKRRKELEEAAKPKALKREEWMLVPPSSNILGALGDPLKLKPRQFSRSTNAAARTAPNNLWTETPQERQQRIADEVSGKKRRAANPEPEVEDADSRKKQRRDEEIRSVIDGHNKSARNKTLLELHSKESEKTKQKGDEPEAFWDHSRDMSFGGRLMDDSQRRKLIDDAKGLGDRFGSGRSGGYL